MEEQARGQSVYLELNLYSELQPQLTPLGPLGAAAEKHNRGNGTALGLRIKAGVCMCGCLFVSCFAYLHP